MSSEERAKDLFERIKKAYCLNASEEAFLTLIAAALREARRDVWGEVERKFRVMENYYGTMAEGESAPEFAIYLKVEAAMRQERRWCREQAEKETPS